MGQKVSNLELEAHEEMRQRLNGTSGLVQCDGCPAGVLVVPARPGHLDSCRECQKHCICFKAPPGDGGYSAEY